MYDYGDLLGFNYTAGNSTGTTNTTTDFFGYDPNEISIPTSTTANYTTSTHPIPLPPPLMIPTDHFDTAFNSLKSEVGYSSGSSYGSPSSLPSCYQLQRQSLVQRSLSSHSLQKDDYGSFYHHYHHHHHPIFSSLEESRREILDLDTSPMRKVYSTGDLQVDNTTLQQQHGRSQSPLSQEISNTIEGMSKVGRYSSEERKERIERYRSKRNQRNFTKKIKYACRKTLADSRPRIRGRFARNEEMGESSCSQSQWSQIGVDEDEEDEDVLISLLCQFNSLE